MNMNIDDPKLTAYALDELDEPEKSTMARAVAESPEAQQFVAETREMAGVLKSEFASELEKEETSMPANIIDIRDDPWFWSIVRPLSIAAVVALCALIAAVAVFTTQRESFRIGDVGGETQKRHENRSASADSAADADSEGEQKFAEVEAEMPVPAQDSVAPMPAAPPMAAGLARAKSAPAKQLADSASRAYSIPQAPMEKSLSASAGEYYSREEMEKLSADRRFRQDFNTAAYDHIAENSFLDAATNPLSTFSIDVDTASYSNIRRFINEGALPPKDAVRVEEMINYFTYDYPQPEGDKPFGVNVDLANCPWEPAHRLVRIGLKGREIASDKRGASNLVFLLDVSGSMTPAERLPLVKQAMRLLVEKLTENDRVAIVVYAGASGLALPSTTGDRKEQILQALENLQPGGSTNGAEGIQLAYKVAADNFIKGGVNRVILATDGDFNIGVTSQGDLVRLIEEKAKTGVFLSVLGVGTDNLKDSTMQKLADKGNGNYAYLDSLDEARKVLVQQMNGTLVTIAKDVKIQVEFNPARVTSYRLIGYEKRMLRKEDFNNDKVDAGEIGAGHTVTALYEVVPAGGNVNPAASVPPVDPLKYSAKAKAANERSTSSSSELLTVKLRYKKPDGDKSELIERALSDEGKEFANASLDFKFAAAVAEFGMILRESGHKGNGTLSAVLEWAQEGKGSDANGYRAGFIELVRKAQALKKG